MMRKFRLRPHVSKFMIALRVVDAVLVPAILFGLLWAYDTPESARLDMAGLLSLLLTAVAMEAVGLYRRWRGAKLQREIHTVLAGWALVVAGLFAATVATGLLAPLPSEEMVAWMVLSPLAISIAHALGRTLLGALRQKGYNHRRAVIAGAGQVGTVLARKLASVPWAGIEIVGFFDDDPAKRGIRIEGLPVLGSLDDLPAHAAEGNIDVVYLALPMRAEPRMRQLMADLDGTPMAVYMVPDVFVFDLLGSRLIDIDGVPVVSLSESPQIGPSGDIKRLEDLLLASLAAILLSPVLLAVSVLIKLSSPGPVFFGHERIGRNGKRFKCYKFRTMVTDAKEVLERLLATDPEARQEWERDFKLKDDPRVTKIGRFLRRTSLDELPQLLNVFRGEMSLVGPRPIVEAEIKKYNRYYRHFMMVRPGVTGLWQVSGRNDVSYEERIQLDVEYVRNWNVWADLVILAKTFRAVVARQGSY